MIDSHCHLADEAFAGDLEAVVDRAQRAGLVHALCILAAGNAHEAAQAVRLAELWPAVRFSVGVHPHQAGEFAGREDDAVALVGAAIDRNPGVRAIGEIGLDYHYDFAPRDVQRAVFAAQIRLARNRRLPIVIHTREADEDTHRILEETGAGAITGIFHCFTGDAIQARRALDLGFHISFAGILTFPRAQSLREAAAIVPPNRLLAETDSPYLAPVPYRGKRNEPAWVLETAKALAAIRSEALEPLTARLTANFAALMRP